MQKDIQIVKFDWDAFWANPKNKAKADYSDWMVNPDRFTDLPEAIQEELTDWIVKRFHHSPEWCNDNLIRIRYDFEEGTNYDIYRGALIGAFLASGFEINLDDCGSVRAKRVKR